MSLAREVLQTACRRGPVVRVLVLRTAGSAPREAGTSMLVGREATEGTIGGGALEHLAIAQARRVLVDGLALHQVLPLGPRLGQCCGGSMTLLWERFDSATLPPRLPYARALPGGGGAMPDAVAARMARLRPGDPPVVLAGWVIEAAPLARRPVWIWGAGHVGRALVGVLAPLPDLALTWIDTDADRFPRDLPAGVEPVVAAAPAALVRHAPAAADHLILTYSHQLDLALCHALLGHGFASCGLIGSATKWARFRARLADLGHPSAQILRIACPIGDPSLGKHPQAIALGVATALMSGAMGSANTGERAG